MGELRQCPICHVLPKIMYACGDYFIHCSDGCPAPMCDHSSDNATTCSWNDWVEWYERNTITATADVSDLVACSAETPVTVLLEASENEPLALNRLQKGNVFWIKDLGTGEIDCLRFDRIEPATYHFGNDYRFEQFGTDAGIIRWACKYGINWLAYARKPQEL